MTDEAFTNMVTSLATVYAPVLEVWRVLFLAACVFVAILIFVALVARRGLAAYL